jgi:predicted Zn-dependent protease
VSCEAIGRRSGIHKKAELLDGTVRRTTGNEACAGRYRAHPVQETFGARAAFIAYGGHAFHIYDLTAESSCSRMAALFSSTPRSFRELTGPNLPNVQPDRITIHRSRAGETIGGLEGPAKSRISAEEISRLNRTAPDQVLAAGILHSSSGQEGEAWGHALLLWSSKVSAYRINPLAFQNGRGL